MVGRSTRAVALSALLMTAACGGPQAQFPAAAAVAPAVVQGIATQALHGQPLAPTPREVLPWMAAIVPKGDGPQAEDPVCSGSVVASRWVLTAGHCQPSAEGPDVQVAVITGRRDLTNTGIGQYLPVDRAVRMPGWTQQGIAYRNDFTLLHLSRPTSVRPVALASPRAAALFTPSSQARAAGWGALSPSGDPVSVVHSTTLERLPGSVCGQEYGALFDARTQLCGGWKWPSMDHDTCNGDSGGPLAMKVHGVVVEVAATSWGSTCLTEGVPGVYAGVGPAYAWIMSVVSTG
jgi:trypsin